MEQDTTATVIMVTLGNTAKVSSKAQMNNVTTTIITPKCITLTWLIAIFVEQNEIESTSYGWVKHYKKFAHTLFKSMHIIEKNENRWNSSWDRQIKQKY